MRKFGLGLVELAQAILPFGFETTGDETVVGIDSAIAALRPLSLVVCAFRSEAPLRKRAVVISFKCSAAATAASTPTGSSAARTVSATVSSIRPAPVLRQ